MNRRIARQIAMLAGVLALSAAGVAQGQTRAQAPRPNAGEILSRSFQQPQQSSNNGQAQSGERRGFVGAVVGGRRTIRDRDGRRIPVVRARRDRDDRDHRRDRRRRHDHRRHINTLPLGYSWYGHSGYSTTGGYGYETPTVIIVENPPGAAVRTNGMEEPMYVEPPEPPTVTEVALAAMARGDYTDAIARWRERLAEAPEDASAVRALGLSMALDGDLQKGTAMVAHAYQMSPELVHERLEPAMFGGDDELRRTLRRTVVYANRIKTESAWLTVAVLMQAERRDDHAARMVGKARDVGLDGELADRFKGALGAE